jgi:hypothetical protein
MFLVLLRICWLFFGINSKTYRGEFRAPSSISFIATLQTIGSEANLKTFLRQVKDTTITVLPISDLAIVHTLLTMVDDHLRDMTRWRLKRSKGTFEAYTNVRIACAEYLTNILSVANIQITKSSISFSSYDITIAIPHEVDWQFSRHWSDFVLLHDAIAPDILEVHLRRAFKLYSHDLLMYAGTFSFLRPIDREYELFDVLYWAKSRIEFSTAIKVDAGYPHLSYKSGEVSHRPPNYSLTLNLWYLSGFQCYRRKGRVFAC